MINLGLKLGSTNTQYTSEINRLWENGEFQYIELFVQSGTYSDTVFYWKQFPVPYVIHAPHSMAGMNLADASSREKNKVKLHEVIRFADSLSARKIVIHSGVNGTPEECVLQLKDSADTRFIIENKPMKGLDGGVCVGYSYADLKFIIGELNTGFCLDFGHAICAANSLRHDPFVFIKELFLLDPCMFHLTDGDYTSELDSHLHYGFGSFPICDLVKMLPAVSLLTNEAKHSYDNKLSDFEDDYLYLRKYCPIGSN